jgi:hypothetical protein
LIGVKTLETMTILNLQRLRPGRLSLRIRRSSRQA